MNNPEFELLVYLITSAKALPEEPACYGSIRLTEAASRLCKIICEKYPENDAYRALLGCIDADKGKALTERKVSPKCWKKHLRCLWTVFNKSSGNS